MPFDIKAAIKKPWVKYSLIGIGFLGVIYIIYSHASASNASSTATGTNANDAAIAQTQIQAGAAQQAQDSSQSFQLAALKEQDATTLAGQSASIAGQLQLNSQNNATSLSLANVQLQGLQAQLKEATDIQTIQANEQTHISDNNTNVQLNNTNQQAGVAKAQSKDNKTAAIAGTVGTVAVAAIAAFF